MNDSSQRTSSVFAGWFENGPWCSKTVLAALAVAVVGLWFWYSDIRNTPPQIESDKATAKATEPTPAGTASPSPAAAPSKWSKPFPGYVRMSVSYVAGYCIGWLFRKLIRLILVVFTLVIARWPDLIYSNGDGFDDTAFAGGARSFRARSAPGGSRRQRGAGGGVQTGSRSLTGGVLI